MEVLISKFNTIVVSLKKKTYDFLDQRKTDFDSDYTEFKNSINDLHNAFLQFMEKQFNQITNTHRALALIKRFEKLDLPNVTLHDKYIRLLSQYSKDIDFVSRLKKRF